MKKTFFILAALLVCLASCGRKTEYSFNIVADERVLGDGYDRDVKIVELVSTSKHTDEINETITDRAMFYYKMQMSGSMSVGDEICTLYDDATWAEKDGILCIMSMQRMNLHYSSPACMQSIYLNLKEDKLYTAEEYLIAIGMDVEDILSDYVNACDVDSVGDVVSSAVKGVFWQDETMVLVLELRYKLNYSDWVDTKLCFYNCDNGGYFDCDDFTSFDRSDIVFGEPEVIR